MKKLLLPLFSFSLLLTIFGQSTDLQKESFDDNISPKKLGQDIEISIFPNPTKGIIQVSNIISLGIKEIELYDIIGDKAKRTFASGQRNTIELDLSRLASGLYLLRLYDIEGKLVKQERVSKI